MRFVYFDQRRYACFLLQSVESAGMRVFYFASDAKSERKKTGLSPVGDTAANANTNTISPIHSRIQTQAQ
jgi:hypothetical protein